jgi:hypothetical protein
MVHRRRREPGLDPEPAGDDDEQHRQFVRQADEVERRIESARERRALAGGAAGCDHQHRQQRREADAFGQSRRHQAGDHAEGAQRRGGKENAQDATEPRARPGRFVKAAHGRRL